MCFIECNTPIASQKYQLKFTLQHPPTLDILWLICANYCKPPRANEPRCQFCI